jgi:Spy/CpxP family protein refolding chaperone
MQPILAESAPPRGRALVFAVALTLAASIAAIAAAGTQSHRARGHRHHHLPRNGQCPYGYVYVIR